MSTNVTWFDGITYSVPAGGEINWPALSNLLIALGGKAAITTIATQAIRVAVTTPITAAAASDYTVVSNLTVAGAVAINLNAGVAGRIQTFVDGKGDAATNNITINRFGSDTINGATTFVMNKNRQSVTLQYDASTTDWKVISNYFPPGTVTPADIIGVIPANKGGTGVANNVLATTTRIGNYDLTETLTGSTAVTYPNSGTLATLAGAENLSNKVLTTPQLNQPIQQSYEDWLDQGSDPAAPGAGVTRIFTKAGIPYKKTATLPTTQIGGAASGGKNYLAASTSTSAGWASTGTATATTDTTTADLPEPSVGTGILFTLGTTGNYSFARWTLDPCDYNAPRIPLTAAIKTLSGYVGGNAKIEVYSNTASNYSGTSARLALSTDVSAVSALSTATHYLGFYDNPGSSAPYLELRIVTVTATGTLCMSSISTGPGQAVQGAAIGPATSYTPTYGGLGTVTSSNITYAVVGPKIRVFGSFLPGTIPASTLMTMSLPNGWTQNIPVATTQIPGRWYKNTATASNVKSGDIIAVPNSNLINFGVDNFTSSISPYTSQNSDQIATVSVAISVDFWIDINELAGAAVNLGQNAVEYAFSTATTTTAGASDLTSFGYGQQGALFNSIDSVTANSVTTYRVRFLSPIQATDLIQIEISNNPQGSIFGITSQNLAIPRSIQNLFVYGMGWNPVSGSNTDIDIQFFNGGRQPSGATYGIAGSSWAGVNDGQSRWRLKKTAAGVATGFGPYLPPSAANPAGAGGLVPASGLPGRADGNAAATFAIGEKYEIIQTSVTMTTSNQNVISMTLPSAGIWRVDAGVMFNMVGATINYAQASLSLTSVTLDTNYIYQQPNISAFGLAGAVPSRVVTTNGSTGNIVYLVCVVGSVAGGTPTVNPSRLTATRIG